MGPKSLPSLVLLGLALHAPMLAQMFVSVSASPQSPAPLGSLVTWTITVSGASPGTLEYRFRIQHGRADFRTVVDYGPNSTFTWSTIEEGAYQIEASVKNATTGEMEQDTAGFLFSPLVTGPTPTITPSSNPLVYIYSAPACGVIHHGGSRIRDDDISVERMSVTFQSSTGFIQSTPFQKCDSASTVNFYLAGLEPNQPYQVQHVIEASAPTPAAASTIFALGPMLTFTTGSISVTSPPISLPPQGSIPTADGILLQSLFSRTSIATDLNGNVIWYSPPDISYLTRPQTGGTFLGIGEFPTLDPSQQFFREFDLAGITLAETNAARVNEQLATMGVHAINGFHHEARKLSNGQYLVLANSERILTNVQGPGAVDVIGDTILVLDQNLQVVWAWDSFNYLNTSRVAPLNETCALPPTGLACPPIYLASTANDWLHGNALQLTADGNILYSMRDQDWVIKIDYANGAGSGAILWRMGIDGDFQIQSSDPSPWFSHQHDPNFQTDGTTMLVFDDGNERAAVNPAAHSRGQALSVDEPDRMVTLTLNADLGTYSEAVGSAQLLSNGDYHFDSGFILDTQGNLNAQSLEVNPAASIVFDLGFEAPEYRTFRMSDLYTAPQNTIP